MQIFARLRELRLFEKKKLPFIKSQEDRDIVLEVGYHQENNTPLTLKQLFLQGIGPRATVQRRLARLVTARAVAKTFKANDRRTVELTLSPPVLKTYRYLARALARLERAGRGGKRGRAAGKDQTS